MAKNLTRWLCIAAVCATTGCATVTRGTTNDVIINYTPADAEVVTDIGHRCAASPCRLKIARKQEFTITASKKGYDTQSVFVGTKVVGAGAADLAGNVIIGGVVGAGVDVATGAARDHFPNPVTIDLLPAGSTPKKPAATTAPAASKKGIPTS